MHLFVVVLSLLLSHPDYPVVKDPPTIAGCIDVAPCHSPN